MNNMKQDRLAGIRGHMAHALGSLAIKSGEMSLEKCCFLIGYEPELPLELLKSAREDK
ncbi:cyclic lactone autoinducer peptide [Paenibacillus spiritus]|uniref:Cyclic lactone autoinducer peptide n=1 Tax=Paenibacillus spiritus TaxID=2496557 RepID=A0A5J5FY58_9BACL|nr:MULTISPECIES: cyclic lactone autoinducer peptide [Paenibacillus]KAA8998807.1 cyclic lactone autoinducer peptide [Paenibacillus spiritus]